MIVHLADLQRTYRKMRVAQLRTDLRAYLLDRSPPTSAVFRLVSRALYADSRIDNLGLADHWVHMASEAERAAMFCRITTSQLREEGRR